MTKRTILIFRLGQYWVYTCEYFLDRYRKMEADWTLETGNRLRRAIKESIRAYATNAKTARFLDMSQTFSLKVPLIREIFPDARFIVQTRNPYAACVRAAQDFRYEWVQKLEANDETRQLKLKLVSEHWRNTFACATEDLEGDEHAVFNRYEDLVVNPEEELLRIANAVDLTYDTDMIPHERHRLPLGAKEQHKWHPIRADTNRKYLDRLDASMVSVIQKTVGDLADTFGYRPPDSPPEGRR